MSDKTSKKIVTRFPPSPTGFLHIGRARTALFNFLYAQQHDGKLLFRIEDTDKERSKKEFEENIIDCLEWLEIKYDNKEYVRQSERSELYQNYLKKIIDSGKAYISKEENPEEGKRSEVIRFKNPNIKIKFTDIIRGEIEFDTTDLGDFVIAKDMTEPLYHLAVVVDDFEMGVTHIIRGEDGISNTPRQILIQEAIGAPRPLYAHIPLILAPDRSKLSGRHGAVAVTEYRDKGYVPEAIVNYLALLGWNPGTEQEIFTMKELIKSFDLSKVQKAGAVFSEEKLKWMNKQHLQKLSEKDYVSHALKFVPEKYKSSTDTVEKVIQIARDRISVFFELQEMFESGEFDYFFNEPKYEAKDLVWKDEKDNLNTLKHIKKTISVIESMSDEEISNIETIKATLWGYATEHGRGAVLWPIRYALSGMSKSPDPFILISSLGKKDSIKRLTHAEKILNS